MPLCQFYRDDAIRIPDPSIRRGGQTAMPLKVTRPFCTNLYSPVTRLQAQVVGGDELFTCRGSLEACQIRADASPSRLP